MTDAASHVWRIETERLLLRCFEPGDEVLIDAALRVSIEHLRPWMLWVRGEPIDPAERLQMVLAFRQKFAAGEDFSYGVFDAAETELVGAAGSHTRQGPGIREIGYWIRADRLRRGYATECTAALTRAAFEIAGSRRVEIRCDTQNTASRGIPRKLGFVSEGVLRHVLKSEQTSGDAEIWSLIPAEYARSPIRDARMRAFDGTGRELLG